MKSSQRQLATGYPGFLRSTQSSNPPGNPVVADMLVVGGTLHDGSEWFPTSQGDQTQVWAPAFDIDYASPDPPGLPQIRSGQQGTSFCEFGSQRFYTRSAIDMKKQRPRRPRVSQHTSQLCLQTICRAISQHLMMFYRVDNGYEV